MSLPRLIIAMVFAMMGLMVVSAQNTDILIIEGNTLTEQQTITLNPFYCVRADCGRVVDLLFPNLLNINPETGWLIPADDTHGLAESWDIADNTITYHLRDDKFWSDGTPISAYDVFFSYQVGQLNNLYDILLDQHIDAAAPLDEHTIRFVFSDLNFVAVPQTNFPILPAHVYDPDFATGVDYADGDDIEEWFANFPSFSESLITTNPEYSNPTVTGGTYTFVERRFDESIHLIANDNSVAFSYVDVTSSNSAIDLYLRGEINLLVDPPYNRRADLRADENSTVYSYAGDSSFFIALNLTDPDNPQSAFDEEGNPINQGIHPILGDDAVRQAMQMALNVPAMIDAVLEGDGTQIASSLPPRGFGFIPELEPIAYDTMTARQILSDAGWRDMDGDGWRECLGCQFGERGEQLSISLDYYSESTIIPSVDNNALATLIQQQLNDIGMEVFLGGGSSLGMAFDQEFDAVLLDAVDVDLQLATMWDFFRQSEDIVGEGLNFSSYANDDISRLLSEAENISTVDMATRRRLYQEIEAHLQADQPYLWLFSPNRMVVTRQTVDIPATFWEEFLP